MDILPVPIIHTSPDLQNPDTLYSEKANMFIEISFSVNNSTWFT